MFKLLRFWLFVFGSFFLTAHSLYAQPTLPAPTRSSPVELDGLRSRFSGSNGGNPQALATATIPTPPRQPAQQGVQFPEQLVQPKSVNQATFISQPVSSLTQSDEFPHEELPDNFYSDDDESLNTRNSVLNKSLSSQRLAKEDGDETKAATGGWTNKLVKPNVTPIVSVGATLLVVLAAFFLLATLLRKVTPQSNRTLPKEAFECLGRYYPTQKHQLQVLRMGNRIVLVSVMPDGVSTLAELTDPDEVVSFLSLCRRLDSNSATEMFRKTVASMSEEELSRPQTRPVVARRKTQPAPSFDMYSDPDESLAAVLARGRR